VVFIFSRRRSWAPIKVVDTHNNQYSSAKQSPDLYPKTQPTNVNMEDTPQTVDSTEQKTENQVMEFKDSANAESLNLSLKPQVAETNVGEEQQTVAPAETVDVLLLEIPQPKQAEANVVAVQQTSVPAQTVDILQMETPQISTSNPQNNPQPPTPNTTEVNPSNINAETKNKTVPSKRKKHKHKNRNKKPAS